MLTTPTRAWLLASFAALAACASPASNLGTQQQPITMGDPVEGDAYATIGMLLAHAVVSVDGAPAADRVLGICTGTLISPTAVLTAEHCVSIPLLEQSIREAKDPEGNARNIVIEGPIGFRFTFSRTLADVMAGSASMIEVARVDEHADFTPLTNPRAAYRPAPAQWNDIAILHLADKVMGRPFQKLATEELVDALVADEDTLYRAAGYGLTNDEDPMSAGTLTSGVSHLGVVGPWEFTAGADDRQQACRGDSGGPIFTDESDTYQMGIASRIDRPFSRTGPPMNEDEFPPCETGLVYTRIDPYSDWIAARVPDLPAMEPEDAGVDAGVDAGLADGGSESAEAGTDEVFYAAGGGGCSTLPWTGAGPFWIAMWLLPGAGWLTRRRRA